MTLSYSAQRFKTAVIWNGCYGRARLLSDRYLISQPSPDRNLTVYTWSCLLPTIMAIRFCHARCSTSQLAFRIRLLVSIIQSVLFMFMWATIKVTRQRWMKRKTRLRIKVKTRASCCSSWFVKSGSLFTKQQCALPPNLVKSAIWDAPQQWCCRGVFQISERIEKSKSESHGLETSWGFANDVRPLCE